jgi:hypothetical protein
MSATGEKPMTVDTLARVACDGALSMQGNHFVE